MTAAGTSPGAMLAAVEATDVVWAVVAAVAVWLAGWGVIMLLNRDGQRTTETGRIRLSTARREPPARAGHAVQEPLQERSTDPSPFQPHFDRVLRLSPPAALMEEDEAHPTDVLRLPDSGPSLSDESADAAGVLRWLLAETEAEAAAFLRLAPGGAERLVVEPRGLEPNLVGTLARVGREQLISGKELPSREMAAARWLGGGGSKVIVLQGVEAGTASEALRFARFAIESRGGPAVEAAAVEARARAVPGVAWAELVGEPAEAVRVLLAENVDRHMVEEAVGRAVGDSGLRISWIDSEPTELEPRARLLDVQVHMDGQASVEVAIDWKGQELRGRGHGRPTMGGRFEACAKALTDALRPLVAVDVIVEGIYSYPHEDTSLMLVVVRFDGDRLVGAVPLSAGEPDLSAARAVLDAVNRRLAQIAGGSGRI